MAQQEILSVDDVDALSRAHARWEDRGDFDSLMTTLVDEPVYEFHPLGVQLRGVGSIVRYYERVRSEYNPTIEASALLGLIAGTSGAVLEYAIRLRIGAAIVDERLVAVMPVVGDAFGGERIHSSERVLRLLLGEMIDETEPIPPLTTLVPATRTS